MRRVGAIAPLGIGDWRLGQMEAIAIPSLVIFLLQWHWAIALSISFN
ncbi:MAG: hypothetical protein AB4042_16005 [Leptolyngbyaceae cyanobacterium]